jgi:glycosyltransferase involved in cell wall biosynthesis
VPRKVSRRRGSSANEATLLYMRLAYLETHPIQYRAPMLRRIAREPDISLKVFYRSDFSTRDHFDHRWGRRVRWDVSLTEGYDSEVLPLLYSALPGPDRAPVNYDRRLLNYGLAKRLREGRFDALWLMGYTHWFNWVAMLIAKRQGVRVLLREEANLDSHSRGPLKRAVKRVMFEALKRLCDRFLAIGTLNRNYYLHYGVPPERIFMMPYAVDNALFRSRAACLSGDELRAGLKIEPRRPVVLFVGRLIPQKDPHTLLRACAQLITDRRLTPHPLLLIVGDGILMDSLRRAAQDVGRDFVRLVGFQNQTELQSFYALCDVFVLPSLLEPWGLVINEAMNAGCPVIASNRVGAAADLVSPGENGYVFPAGDASALANALHHTLSNPARCRDMGRRSFEIVGRWSFEEDVQGLRQALGLPVNLKPAEEEAVRVNAKDEAPDWEDGISDV